MYLAQAIPLLALDNTRHYLPREIAMHMPDPMQEHICGVLRRFASNNHMRGNVTNPRNAIGIPHAQPPQPAQGHGEVAPAVFRLAENGHWVYAFSGEIWRDYAGSKSLQEALLFSFAVCLLPQHRAYTADDLLRCFPGLCQDANWQYRMRLQAVRLLRLYQHDDHPQTAHYSGRAWASFVTPCVRIKLLQYLFNDSADCSLKPFIVAAVANKVAAYNRNRTRFLRKPDPKSTLKPSALALVRMPAVAPSLAPTRPKSVSWQLLPMAVLLLLATSLGFQRRNAAKIETPKEVILVARYLDSQQEVDRLIQTSYPLPKRIPGIPIRYLIDYNPTDIMWD